ncbi:hypothetical protein SAMN05192579_104208 [Rhodanobacter glycinis]|uniref:Uncharacterized protein n=1 Tax=Rhodanobacter glycinis TaxID=582702 RepID=A0A1I4B1T6_9GAMM|nr:hypothetical protein SAMN05192579_104208 [Rhodanobacter glycinis]
MSAALSDAGRALSADKPVPGERIFEITYNQ